MKTTASIKTLQHQLDRISKIPGSKGTQSHLIKLIADMAGITLIRSTSECLASVICEADVDEENEGILVSYDKLASVISRLPASEVSFSIALDKLVITSGPSVQRIPLATPDEWNQMPIPDVELKKIDGAMLVEAIRIAAKAASRDSQNNANFVGVHFMPNEQGVWCVGSDRKRIHGVLTDLEDVDFSMSNESAAALIGICEKSDFSMGMTKNQVRCAGADFEMTFPTTKDRLPFNGVKVFMLPTEVEPMGTFPCDKLKEAVRLAADNNERHAITIEPSKNCVFINGKSDDGSHGNQASTKIDCKQTMDKEVVMVPGHQLVEAIDGCGDDSIEVTHNKSFIHFYNREKNRVFGICKMLIQVEK